MQVSRKILAPKGIKKVGASVPLMFIFLRKRITSSLKELYTNIQIIGGFINIYP